MTTTPAPLAAFAEHWADRCSAELRRTVDEQVLRREVEG